MDEAKRLNMLEGNFFWLWLDASKDVDIFHNISNRTLYNEDNDQDVESLRDNDEALVYERFDRSKRGDADNNTIEDQKSPDTLMKIEKVVDEDFIDDEFYVKNSSINSKVRRNINISDTHSVNKKLLYVNFSQSYSSNRNISSGSMRNYNVNNKGVETSKIENNSIAKGMPFHNRNNSRRNSYREMKNESFNKYVNSIDVDDVNVAKHVMLGQDDSTSNDDIREINDRIGLSSDIRDFLMNPKVHASSVHNFKDKKTEKRSHKHFKNEEVIDKERENIKENITVIFKSLPIGLLALHPQPVKIGKFMYLILYLVSHLYFDYIIYFQNVSIIRYTVQKIFVAILSENFK